MNTLQVVAQEIARLFQEHDVRTDALTVIFNFREAKDGAAADCALSRNLLDFNLNRPAPLKPIDPREFALNGIRFKLESPVHESG